uniref:Putative transient receptor potential cation channel trpm n=2 Tax=Lutzomyia longipalpis TaxID=7200 RepID=A0A7G3B3W2_LUTLO
MMGKMVKNMIYFVVLLLVVLMSFGVSRQAILFPNNEADWRLVRDVYFQPYFMLYGEVFADDIDPPCGEDPSQDPCVTGHWVTPITMSMYLLIANILLINLLIAVFNNIFIEVNAVSHQVWMFQRFTVVMEYQLKPVLPPPLIAFCHIYSLLKYFVRKAKGLQGPRDNGLKLFLEREDMERLYDFEEECIEGYFREQDVALLQSTEERIKSTTDRVENMSQKIEDINQKENLQTATVQSIEFRLRKMEESAEQILSHLAVIHRFMSTHTSINSETLPMGLPRQDSRTRTTSENETAATLNLNPRRKFNRSLTEVRPDAYIFDDGLHFEVRPVPEESEVARSRDTLTEATLARKVSTQSDDSDIFGEGGGTVASKPITIEVPRKPPILNVVRQETTSTESHDTLTPIETSDAHTLIGEGLSAEDIVDINYDGSKPRAARRRNSSSGRRNSESCSNYDVKCSQNSLHLGMSRRQLSLTQSEPESNEPPAKPIVKHSRNLLLAIHTEYTSITDELESVCHMLASPTTSIPGFERPKNVNELSNPEFAALLEKQHLKECEENDYVMLERLLAARGSLEETDESLEASLDQPHRRILRRETAVELPVTPSKSIRSIPPIASAEGEVDREGGTAEAAAVPTATIRSISIEQQATFSRQHSPQTAVPRTDFLNPITSLMETRIFKKSSESLQKNSSTDTEYSLQPYRVIKQSSNETNTSLTSSVNIDNASLANDSLDVEGSAPTEGEDIKPSPSRRGQFLMGAVSSGAAFLRKQFSIEKSHRIDPDAHSFSTPMPISEDTEDSTKESPKFLTCRTGKSVVTAKESSSSTESRDERQIPTITTNVVQDEIARLSSNIKSSTDEEKEAPFNETMC